MDTSVTLGILCFLAVVLGFAPVRSLIKKEPIDWRVTKAFGLVLTIVLILSGIAYLFLKNK